MQIFVGEYLMYTYRRLNAKELMLLWCWRRLLKVPWTARRSNQSILKEINPEYSLEGLTLKLKLQYFSRLMGRADSLDKTLILGKIGGKGEEGSREWDGWMASPTQWTWVCANSGDRRTGKPDVLQSMELQRTGFDLETEQQQWRLLVLSSKPSGNFIFLGWLFIQTWDKLNWFLINVVFQVIFQNMEPTKSLWNRNVWEPTLTSLALFIME